MIGRRGVLALASSAALPAQAAAQPVWPFAAVRLIVPAPAGSSLDLIARQLADALKQPWGQAVVVENKPGAGGMLGLDVVAKAAPDGYTLGIGFNGPIAFAPFMYRKMPYDPARDLQAVVMTTSQPNVLAVHAAVPVRDVNQFVQWARSRDGKLNYASLGQGSSAHLTMELFLAEAGIKGVHIPFNGSPPAALSLAQGDTDAAFMVAPALMPHVRSGKVRLLAVSSRERAASLKELPSLADAGFAQVEALAWNGLFAPTGTPSEVVRKINTDVNSALQAATVRAALDAQGLTPVGGSPGQFAAVIEADSKRWGAIIRRIGLNIDP